MVCHEKYYGKNTFEEGSFLAFNMSKFGWGVSLNLDSSKAPVGWRLSSLKKNDDT